MPPPICHACRQSFQLRLRHKLGLFQQSRRAVHVPTKAPPSLYWSTLPPTNRQLQIATWFFNTFQPTRLWTADEWRNQNQPAPEQIVPEVAFLGRSNVGKSTLLNALLNKPGLNPVGPKPGKTIVMTAWGLSPTTKTGGALPGFNGDTSTRLTVLDVPGYGFRSQSTWGAEITKYLSRRKQLRKVFVLIDTTHGIVARDRDMFELLRSQNIPHQVIASKADAFLDLYSNGRIGVQDALLKIAHASQVNEPGELLVTASRRKQDHESSMEGIAAVRWSVLRAVGLDAYATQQFSKTVKPHLPPDTQKTAPNSHNPFKLQQHVYQDWIGGPSKPIMGGIPFPPSRNQDNPTEEAAFVLPRIPSSHPRSPSNKENQPPRQRFDLSRGLEALLTPHQLASQIKSKEVPTAPPPSPPADPRSNKITPPPMSTAPPETLSTAHSTSSAPRGMDAFLELLQPSNPKQQPSTRSPTRQQRATRSSSSTRLSSFGRKAPLKSTSSSSDSTSTSSPSSSSSTPAFTGPGVSRGLDAFISATQSKPRQQQQRGQRPAAGQALGSSRKDRMRQRR